MQDFQKKVHSRAKLGVKIFAEALMIIPKTLAQNSGLDQTDALLKLQQEHDQGNLVGLDVFTGDTLDPIQSGIFDNARVKAQIIESA